MSDTNTLFDGQENGGDPQGQEQDLTQLSAEEAMETLVGEGKKYANPAELAKALIHSQAHIATLETENKTYRTQVEQSKGVEDVLAALKAKQDEPAPAQEPAQDQGSQQPAQGSGDIDIEALLEQKLAQRDAKANKQHVLDTLQQKLGSNAAKAYKEVGDSLGIDLDELAGRKPEAVIKLVAGQSTPGSSTPSLPGTRPGGALDSAQSSGQGHVMTKKAIQTLYDQGKISLAEKHRRENEGYKTLGRDKFYS